MKKDSVKLNNTLKAVFDVSNTFLRLTFLIPSILSISEQLTGIVLVGMALLVLVLFRQGDIINENTKRMGASPGLTQRQWCPRPHSPLHPCTLL